MRKNEHRLDSPDAAEVLIFVSILLCFRTERIHMRLFNSLELVLTTSVSIYLSIYDLYVTYFLTFDVMCVTF